MTKKPCFMKEMFVLINIENETQKYRSKKAAEIALSRKKEGEFALVRVCSEGSSINTTLLNNPNFSIDSTIKSARTFIEKTFGNKLRDAANKMRRKAKLASEKARKLASEKACV